jgi:hypothetical protein
LTANYWLLGQQSNISAIFAKVELFNFGQITGVHFRILCAAIVFGQFEKCCC